MRSNDDENESGEGSRSKPSEQRSLWQRFQKTFFGTETRAVGSIGFVGAAIVTIVLAVIFSSGGSGKAKPIIVTAGGETVFAATESPKPKSAVEEIASSDIWSSSPVTYDTANEALKAETTGVGSLPVGESVTSPPNVVLAATLADATGNPAKSVLVLGKVQEVQTVASRFVGERPSDEGKSKETVKSVVRVELVSNRSTSVYIEFAPPPTISRGNIVIALGRVAAVGETHNDAIRSAYLLTEHVEQLESVNEIDSARMRRLYEDLRHDRGEGYPDTLQAIEITG